MTNSPTFNPALIVVDLQEDFLPPNGSLAVKDGRATIPLILELMNLKKYHWKAIIATKDWHPQNHTSFASNHGQSPYTTKEFGHPLDPSKPSQVHVLWPDHCVQETFGSCFPPEFEEVYNSLVESQAIPVTTVKKGYLQDREYYSCFQDVWKLHHTECEAFLKDNKITHVFTVGLAYDYCVLNSSIDSADLGFETFVIKECSRAVYPDKEEETDKSYKKNGIKIISLDAEELEMVKK